MKGFKDLMAKVFFGRTLTEALQLGICVQCSEKVNDEEDKEYRISGFCKACQDELFSKQTADGD